MTQRSMIFYVAGLTPDNIVTGDYGYNSPADIQYTSVNELLYNRFLDVETSIHGGIITKVSVRRGLCKGSKMMYRKEGRQ